MASMGIEAAPALYIVTGTSGTGVEPSLEKYAEQYGGYVVRLEHHLVERASQVFGKELTMIELFCKAEGVLRDLWVDACISARDEVVRRLDDSDVFLRLNAAWYHVLSGGFVSGLHIPTLAQLPTPKLVITLIDDVYDTLARLQRPDKIFEDFDRGETAVNVLLKLLAWRELEVRQAQQIALSFGKVPYHLFPVKHPVTTFAKLLKLPPDAVTYLSHPISVVRREEHESGGEFEAFVEGVAQLLRESEDIVLLEPTAIDEWRMVRNSRTGEVQADELKRRWQLPVSPTGDPVELLAAPLAAEETARVSQPLVREDLAAIRVLSSEIQKQVSWRDRMMVEQAARPITLRPFASEYGKASGGVLEENDLHWELMDYFSSDAVIGVFPEKGERAVAAQQRSPAIVYHPPTDEKSRQVGAVVEIVSGYAARGQVADWPEEEEARGEVRSELIGLLRKVHFPDWVSASEHLVGQKINDVLRAISGRSIHIAGESIAGTLDMAGGLRRRDESLRAIGVDLQEALREGWKRSPRYSLRPFKQGHLLTDELATVTLAEKALSLIAADRKREAPD